MPAARVTVNLADVVRKLNTYLASEGTTPAQRQVLATFVEGLLMDRNAYRGFGYQRSEWKADGSGLRDGYDDTRRLYY